MRRLSNRGNGTVQDKLFRFASDSNNNPSPNRKREKGSPKVKLNRVLACLAENLKSNAVGKKDNIIKSGKIDEHAAIFQIK